MKRVLDLLKIRAENRMLSQQLLYRHNTIQKERKSITINNKASYKNKNNKNDKRSQMCINCYISCFLSILLVNQSTVQYRLDVYIIQIMWVLQSQPISKQYRSGLLSRAFFLSASCCVFAFAVPILILVSIGYSWNNYAVTLVQPQLIYQNHQLACLMSDSSTIYDSTFTNQITNNNYQSVVGVGGEQGNYAISVNVFPTSTTVDIQACSLLVYLTVTLSNMQSLAVLPLQFSNPSSMTAKWTSLTENGIIYVKTTSPIPQSSIIQSDFTAYFDNKTQVLNMIDVHRSYATTKNVTLVPSIISSTPTYSSSSSSSFSYIGTFSVPGQQLLTQVSLLSNLRTFIPYFIYLFILFWVFLATPTVRWMLQNKIYRSKSTAPKIKYH